MQVEIWFDFDGELTDERKAQLDAIATEFHKRMDIKFKASPELFGCYDRLQQTANNVMEVLVRKHKADYVTGVMFVPVPPPTPPSELN